MKYSSDYKNNHHFCVVMGKYDLNCIREIKDKLKAVKTTVNDVEKATSNHAERLDEIEQEKIPELKSEQELGVRHD